jgi:diguanylate cyclase (GGDEF)-like protein
MSQTQRFGWSMAAAVLAVMALVFAALVSSWLGISAEQRSGATVLEVSLLARRVLEAKASADELGALLTEYALAALRGERVDEQSPQRLAYARTRSALRAQLERIGAEPLEASERVLLDAASGALERFDRVVAEIAAMMRRGAQGDRLEASAYVLESAAPLAEHAANLVLALEARVARRAEAAAEQGRTATERARVQLVAFGGLSLLLALLLARSLADSMAKRAELMRQLTELARVDGLTGVANRRAWDEELARGLERARRTGRRCAVGLIDLDHFKRYNDTQGHQRGDALLRETARALAARLRGGDLLARYGGEEFAVLLHGCDLKGAFKLFERLHGAPPEGQTFSAGITDSDGREPGEEVIGRADRALYRAKTEGRNRTATVEPPAAAALVAV